MRVSRSDADHTGGDGDAWNAWNAWIGAAQRARGAEGGPIGCAQTVRDASRSAV